MTKQPADPLLSRRSFLALAGAAAATLAVGEREALAAGRQVAQRPYGPFRMGIQSYSLRGYSTDDALAKTGELGLHWWEGFPQHFPLTDDPKTIADYLAKLADHKIRMVTYGVVDLSSDESDARKKFAFAKAMGIHTLSASPSADSFNLLDRLVEEYRVNVAIHNHGPGDHSYGKIAQVEAAIAGHNPRIGACDDTGHYLRADQDPVQAARQFGKRLFGVHLKDVKADPDGGKSFTEVGKGLLDTVGLLRVLKENGYSQRGIISLEYEDHPDDPMSYIKECLTATQEAVRKV